MALQCDLLIYDHYSTIFFLPWCDRPSTWFMENPMSIGVAKRTRKPAPPVRPMMSNEKLTALLNAGIALSKTRGHKEDQLASLA